MAVPTPTQINAVLAATDDLNLVGPFDDGSQGTNMVIIYKLLYLLPKYIGMMLGCGGPLP